MDLQENMTKSMAVRKEEEETATTGTEAIIFELEVSLS